MRALAIVAVLAAAVALAGCPGLSDNFFIVFNGGADADADGSPRSDGGAADATTDSAVAEGSAGDAAIDVSTSDALDAKGCNFSADCPNGCCAPTTDMNGNPVPGPLVCKPADGTSYDCALGSSDAGCLAGTSCTAGLCRVTVANNSCWCEKPCTNASQCGNGVCVPLGGGTCNGFTSTCLP